MATKPSDLKWVAGAPEPSLNVVGASEFAAAQGVALSDLAHVLGELKQARLAQRFDFIASVIDRVALAGKRGDKDWREFQSWALS